MCLEKTIVFLQYIHIKDLENSTQLNALISPSLRNQNCIQIFRVQLTGKTSESVKNAI